MMEVGGSNNDDVYTEQAATITRTVVDEDDGKNLAGGWRLFKPPCTWSTSVTMSQWGQDSALRFACLPFSPFFVWGSTCDQISRLYESNKRTAGHICQTGPEPQWDRHLHKGRPTFIDGLDMHGSDLYTCNTIWYLIPQPVWHEFCVDRYRALERNCNDGCELAYAFCVSCGKEGVESLQVDGNYFF